MISAARPQLLPSPCLNSETENQEPVQIGQPLSPQHWESDKQLTEQNP